MCRKLTYLVSSVVVLGVTAGMTNADIIAYWPFDEGTGNVAHDVIGNHDGQFTGSPTWISPGQLGAGALEVNGSNYVNCGNVSTSGDITVALWIRANSQAHQRPVAASNGDYSTDPGWMLMLRIDSPPGGLWFRIHGSDSGGWAGGDLQINETVYEANTWVHMVITFDSVTREINGYINGELRGTATAAVGRTLANTTNDLRFGNTGTGENYSGALDEVAIWDHALSANEVMSVFTLGPLALDPRMAGRPSPPDEATDVPRDVVLGWSLGESAITHDVYLGTVFDDVNSASRTNPRGVLARQGQTATTYDPAMLLDYGQTYYWRIDEANAPTATPVKGIIWSFTVETFAYPIENITATASSSDVGMGPGNTINGSGLDANDLHSTASTAMWLSSSTGPQPTWIQYEFDRAYKLHQMWVWNYNAQFENIIGFGLKDVAVQYSTNGVEWKALSDVRFAWGPGAAGYAHDTIVDFGGIVAKYVKITAKSNWRGQAQYGLSEVRFFYIPVWAREPNPDSGATGVGVDNATVSWRAGREAASHKVYFSASRRAVVDETISPVSIPANGSYTSYNVGALDLGRTYYWKVNEVNEAETPTTWEGDIWNFKTAEYLVVDDCESYGDGTEPGPPPLPGNRIWYTWKDGGGWTSPAPGWGGNGTGSVIDLSTSPAHEGSRQALTCNYDNDGTNMLGQTGKKFYSEITADLADLGISRDWTRAGVKALTLYFYGDPNNDATAAEQMYVKVNGVKRVYDGDMADIRTATWHEWNIDLSSVGTNLQNVTQISIGFGNENATTAGGSGVVYFDNIRLYPARCRADVIQPEADLNDDCVVDYLDLQIITNQWLTAGHLVTPVDPGTAGLQAQYQFEGNTNDSSGNARNGTAMGGPLFVAGKVGQAISLDGIDDYVNIDGYKGILADAAGVQQAFTLSAWIKARSDGEIITWGTNTGGQRMTFRVDTVIRVEHGSGNIRGTNGPDLRDDQWHHVAATIPQGARMMDVRLYVDGSDVTPGSTTTAAFNLKANVDVRIGMGGPTGGRFLTGLIDDARIYDRALLPGQVAWLAGITAPFSKPFDLNVDGAVNFKDYAVLVDSWLEEFLWP